MMFLEDILKADRMTLMKWKHLYKEKGRAEKSKIHIKYFDENEKQKKNSIITWNDVQGFPIFSEDKKDRKVRTIKE
ncbi:unnamed protein product [Rhizophagus irregularis]|nr:unnamed protein product [Rhizophagus irregularis]